METQPRGGTFLSFNHPIHITEYAEDVGSFDLF
jgi:hypothetical protein